MGMKLMLMNILFLYESMSPILISPKFSNLITSINIISASILLNGEFFEATFYSWNLLFKLAMVGEAMGSYAALTDLSAY